MNFLGFDGGGTKTAAAITDVEGNILAYATTGPTNPNGIDPQTVKEELDKLYSLLKEQNERALQKVSYVFGGFSGTENNNGKKLIQDFIKDLFSDIPVIIDNDAVNALYSGTLGEIGVVQIAGTGSIAFGINENGERSRTGGWGFLIDDEGSGYALGREALSQIFKAYDGRGPETKLSRLITSYFNVNKVQELIPIIYGNSNSRQKIAPLSKFVVEAASLGDQVALEIIANAGIQLGKSISALISKLFTNYTEKIPVVLTGGVFNSYELFLPHIETEIKKHNFSVRFIKPELPPIGGSIAAGMKAKGIKVNQSFIENFNRSLNRLSTNE